MIRVVDAIMGQGKTHDAIIKMKESNKNFVYITPFLGEVDRILNQVDNCYEPNNWNKEGSKRYSFLNLIKSGVNVVSTHALFKSLTKEDYEIFEDYDLILDEVVDPIEIMHISSDDIRMLRESNKIKLDEYNRVSFCEDSYDGTFTYLRKLCKTSNVILVNDTFLVWNFPIEVFTSFRSVTILTYLFEGSVLSCYFKYFDIPYQVDTRCETEVKKVIKENLNIYDGNSNDIGYKMTSFSVNWFDNSISKEELKKIGYTTSNVFHRGFNTKSTYNAYTTYKKYESKVKGSGFSKGFIPVNSRATNEFAEKQSMAYLANRYMNPMIIKFFHDKGIEVNQDLWALGELLQWVWRGCIRKGEIGRAHV